MVTHTLTADGVLNGDQLPGPHLELSLSWIARFDPHFGPHGQQKSSVFYWLAKQALPSGIIIELGSYHGLGTMALCAGAQDGQHNPVVCVDSYTDRRGWINEPYGPQDLEVWQDHLAASGYHAELARGEVRTVAQQWQRPFSLLVWDLGCRNVLTGDLLAWEQWAWQPGGVLAIRDLDDFSQGTRQAITDLQSTGRWGNPQRWPAYITSLERL